MEFWNSLLYLMYAIIKRSGLISRRLPPGPLPLPLFRNILKLGTKPDVSLAELAKVNGPVMNLELGLSNAVVILSVEMPKEVLQKNDTAFSYRALFDAARPYYHNNRSIVMLPPGPKWRAMRRLCVSHVFSSSKFDANRDMRRRKVQELIPPVEECCQAGTAINIGQAVFNTNLNSMSWLFFSKDLADANIESGREFKKLIRAMFEIGGEPKLVDFFPQFSLLRMIDAQGIRGRAEINNKKTLDLFDTLIHERLEKKKSTNLPEKNDALDALLDDIQRGNNGEVELSDLSHFFEDLFLAGTDTTTSTIEWTMAELLHDPEKLKLAQAELEHVIGKENLIEEADVGRLPYSLAIIKETLRLHPSAPFLVPRAVITDVKLGTYTVQRKPECS